MSAAQHLLKKHLPVIIGIAGGSGSGKTWLANQVLQRFQKEACLISQDDFYLDRSHLSPARRQKINFDHPRSIDWVALENTLKGCIARKNIIVPCYDFATHARLAKAKQLSPKPLILVEGLWLLRKPSVRLLFDYTIFLGCPNELRLERRLQRDARERGRTRESIQQQFEQCVAPMHERFVEPQRRWADCIFTESPTRDDIEQLVSTIKTLI